MCGILSAMHSGLLIPETGVALILLLAIVVTFRTILPRRHPLVSDKIHGPPPFVLWFSLS
jgi:hypothetical protein